MPQRIVDRLELVQVDPEKRKRPATVGMRKRGVEFFEEVMPVGERRQRVEAGQLVDARFRQPLLGNIFVDIDPAAAVQGLEVDHDGPAAFEPVGLQERLTAFEIAFQPGKPCVERHPRLRLGSCRIAQPVLGNTAQLRSRYGQLVGYAVEFPVAPVADDEAPPGIEHREPARHVVQCDVEPAVELLDFLRVAQEGNGVALEDLERPRHLADLVVVMRRRHRECRIVERNTAHALRNALDAPDDVADDDERERADANENEDRGCGEPFGQRLAARHEACDVPFGDLQTMFPVELEKILHPVGGFYVVLDGACGVDLGGTGGEKKNAARMSDKVLQVGAGGLQKRIGCILDF